MRLRSLGQWSVSQSTEQQNAPTEDCNNEEQKGNESLEASSSNDDSLTKISGNENLLYKCNECPFSSTFQAMLLHCETYHMNICPQCSFKSTDKCVLRTHMLKCVKRKNAFADKRKVKKNRSISNVGRSKVTIGESRNCLNKLIPYNVSQVDTLCLSDLVKMVSLFKCDVCSFVCSLDSVLKHKKDVHFTEVKDENIELQSDLKVDRTVTCLSNKSDEFLQKNVLESVMKSKEVSKESVVEGSKFTNNETVVVKPKLLIKKKRKCKKARMTKYMKKEVIQNWKETGLIKESYVLLRRLDLNDPDICRNLSSGKDEQEIVFDNKVESSKEMSVKVLQNYSSPNQNDGVINLSSNENIPQSKSSVLGEEVEKNKKTIIVYENILLNKVENKESVYGNIGCNVVDTMDKEVECSNENVHLCDGCGFITNEMSIFNEHLVSCNPEASNDDEKFTAKEHDFPCSYCAYKSQNLPELNAHLDAFHVSNEPDLTTYQCVHCVFASPSIVDMKNHKHFSANPFTKYCICPRASTKTKKQYCRPCREQDQKISGDEGRVYYCVACDYYSLSKTIVDGYCASHCLSCVCQSKRDRIKPATPFSVLYTHAGTFKTVWCCAQCSYACHNLSLLVVHRERKHPTHSCNCFNANLKYCFLCRKSASAHGEFDGFADLDRAHVKRMYACVRCEFVCCAAAEMKEHATRLHGEFHEQCGRHWRVGDGVAKNCGVCLKIFMQQETTVKFDDDLRALYSCQHCPMLTESSVVLREHFKKCRTSAVGFNPSKVYSCNVCFFLTCDRVELICHGRRHNEGKCACRPRPDTKKYKCTYCTFTTNVLGQLVKHVSARKKSKCIRTVSSKNVYFCFECPFVSHTLHSLNEHLELRGGCIGGVCYCAAPEFKNCAKCKARRKFFLCVDCGFMSATPKPMQGHREMRGPFDNVVDNYFATAFAAFCRRKFWCSYCMYTKLDTLEGIRNHVRLKHADVRNVGPTKEYIVKYICFFCMNPVINLLKHVFSVHGKLLMLCQCEGVHFNMLRVDCVDKSTHDKVWSILCMRRTNCWKIGPGFLETREDEEVGDVENSEDAAKCTDQVTPTEVDEKAEDPLANLGSGEASVAEADIPHSTTYTNIFRCLQCNFLTVDYTESFFHNCYMVNKNILRDAVNGFKNDHNYVNANIMRNMFNVKKKYPKVKSAAKIYVQLPAPLEAIDQSTSQIKDVQILNEASDDDEFLEVVENDDVTEEALEDDNSGNESDYDIVEIFKDLSDSDSEFDSILSKLIDENRDFGDSPDVEKRSQICPDCPFKTGQYLKFMYHMHKYHRNAVFYKNEAYTI